MKTLLVDKKSGAPIRVKVGKYTFGENEKIIISGPCAVESYDIMLNLCKELKALGVHMLRGGAFKPRTSPYDFQGLKHEGVKILSEMGKIYDMPIVTEVMDARDIEELLPHVDVLQVGSRNMYNYTLLKELGKVKKPILLKRGMSATLNEWLNAAEYIMSEGNENIILCERGIRTYETATRNTMDINAIAYIKENCRLPIIVDPSHGVGIRNLVPRVALGGIATGGDGLIIESHIMPDNALSDSKQTIDMDTLKTLIDKVKQLESIIY